MNISLTRFCKDRNLPKSSVHARAKELGINLANGLNETAVAQLEQEFSAQPQVSAPAPTTVEVGNHSITLADPTLPQVYSLECLRSGEAVSFEDPLAIAHQFLAASDLLLAGMDADIRERQQKLRTTQQAKDAIVQKRQKLELEARLYQLQTEQLNDALSSETTLLQEQLKELQRMGKQPSVS